MKQRTLMIAMRARLRSLTSKCLSVFHDLRSPNPSSILAWLALSLCGVTHAAEPPTLHLTKVRVLARAGHEAKLEGARITGSNAGATTDFETMAKLTAPAAGQWLDIELPPNTHVFRFIKFEGAQGSYGNVAEVEFYSGARKLTGASFGTQGSRNNQGHVFAHALDGDPATFFDGVSPNDQYVGLDLGEASQCAAPVPLPGSGGFAEPQQVTLTSATPGATIHWNWQSPPDAKRPRSATAPIEVKTSGLLYARASKAGLGDSPLVIAAYRIGDGATESKAITTFHIGNSLTDTIDGWLKPVTESAGRALNFHRFTIPGAPTDWLWDHPGQGFGDSRVAEAFLAFGPIHHLTTQPFGGHNRSVENEAEYSGKFFELCRKHNPDVGHWLYCQWPSVQFKTDTWAKGEGATKSLQLAPATTWQQGVANHLAYTEAVRQRMDDTHDGRPVRIVPGGVALAKLKDAIEAGEGEGLGDFFAETFTDDIHLSLKGRYLVACVFYACFFAESPEGKLSPLNSGLSAAQARLCQRLAWESVKDYRWAKMKD